LPRNVHARSTPPKLLILHPPSLEPKHYIMQDDSINWCLDNKRNLGNLANLAERNIALKNEDICIGHENINVISPFQKTFINSI